MQSITFETQVKEAMQEWSLASLTIVNDLRKIVWAEISTSGIYAKCFVSKIG